VSQSRVKRWTTLRGANCGALAAGSVLEPSICRSAEAGARPMIDHSRHPKFVRVDLVSLLEGNQNRDSPLVRIGQILARGPCAGKFNEILLGITAKTKSLHERHRCRIESRNGTTSIGSFTKHSPRVWQLQFHVNKTAKDSSPFNVSVSCTFSAKRLQNRGIDLCKNV